MACQAGPKLRRPSAASSARSGGAAAVSSAEARTEPERRRSPSRVPNFSASTNPIRRSGFGSGLRLRLAHGNRRAAIGPAVLFPTCTSSRKFCAKCRGTPPNRAFAHCGFRRTIWY